MKRRFFVAAFVAAALLSVPLAGEALAEPSVWLKARDPVAASRATLLEEADQFLLKHDLAQSESIFDATPAVDLLRMRDVYLLEALKRLEQAGGAESPDPRVRLRMGHVLRRLGQDRKPLNPGRIEEAIRVLLTVAHGSAPQAITTSAWNELAIAYAVLGKRDQEVHAYGQALAHEPLGHHRAVLFANRAESYMGMGRLDDAIQGYREALRSLLPIEMFQYGVTALWGLAVATDRDGDLDGALASIALARAYDRDDRKIHEPSWFFSPPHDEAWYEALGAWSAARSTDLGAVRAEAYTRAIEAWEAYLERAPDDDRWIPLGRVRLEACKKERERVLQAARRR
ncbi:hypothetical protein [Polyangium jinanense]|uniref:Tetratricopeptide repeat protein n=1 Tax=Polyangium jinanense TaxID=2829994 RepID=A0A9X3X036_9BACT|nr:hypothetical protein [Polyangium jinanense]MDC3952487.1 hypothetical protein [Polyangium jinanense]MDC3980115.1 hypothetical protein [Polyangium jinanense]